MAVKKYVYKFSEGNGSMRELLGGKGANLAEMSRLGMPVPEGYTITTEACIQYYEDGEKISPVIQKQIDQYTAWLQKTTGKKFGDKKNPLLVSVRSGARASMPGMMDTILNLGMNDEVVKAVEEKSGNKRFAYDSYRRFVMMFGDVVMGLDKAKFEEMIDAIKAKKGVKDDIDLDADDMVELTKQFKEFYKKSLKQDFPQDPKVQLNEAIKAVFRSWNNERAIFYRKQNDIPDSWGTAVSVVTMVFGNMGNDCATGVCFSRNPATGDNKYFYGEYLINAQGEDVVSGARTPQEISKKGSQEWAKGRGISEAERKAKYPSLEESMPKVFKQLTDIKNRLEKHYHDMQDMEFTIQEGKLYMLQCRNGKRTANAALKIAVDMVKEGLATKDQALMMVDPKQLDNLLHPTFDTADLKAKAGKIITKGLAAAPGAGTGSIVFSAEDAEAADKEGRKVVLVRLETSPEDIKGMAASQAIVTVRGGMTSHAAVVARGMGACCVSGCGDIHMDEEHKKFTIGDKTFKEGDVISVDGNTGCIYEGEVKSAPAKISGNFATFMKWADERRTMQIRTNADTPADAQRAVEFGAEGVGLVRTEHMFFNSKERIEAIRSFCVAQTPEQRETALKLMEPYQEEDFYGIFDALGGRPVTVRLLDPPLHEFLPKTKDEAEAIAKKLGITLADVEEADTKLKEFNPMMGHRGCRLDVTYPELGEMQTRAIIKAAIKINKKHPRWHFEPEIMVPLVGEKKELDFVADIIRKSADDEIAKEKAKLTYHIGTMIEVPRGAINAGELAKTAEFFSFGTNDLTQMTMGFSRDDAGKFLNSYYEHHIYDDDPFAHIDVNGVGKLVRWAAEQGRATRPNIHLGVCGEHGGDPKSIHFFQTLGLNYVSCSPFRVPLARLAAAQAAIEVDGEKKAAKKAPAKKTAAKKTTAKKTASKPAAKKTAPKKAAVKKVPAKKTAAKKAPVKKPAAKKTAKKASRKK